jgi:hypothetical protein
MSAEYLDDDDFDPRESRLLAEFAEMQELRREGTLIDFDCARMAQEELDEWLKPRVSMELVAREADSFSSVEAFQARSPGAAPDKYLVRFRCRGIARRTPRPPAGTVPEREAAPRIPRDDELEYVDEHLMEIVLGLDYLDEGPRMVWITNIFHPNILRPYLCDRGRPFAPGTGLKSICLMVGQMIQYRLFNLASVLDPEARAWAEQNLRRLPLDRRDLLTGKVTSAQFVEVLDGDGQAAASGRTSPIEWV